MSKIFKNIPIILLLSGLLLVGLRVYKDYGISWDGPGQRKYGTDIYNYITGENKKLLKNKDRYYGTTSELLLMVVEKTFHFEDIKQIYEMRHLLTFLIYFQGVLFFYLLCGNIFKSKTFATLGTLFFVLSPRIFAHAFYNSKDIPFLAFFITTTYFSLKFIQKQNLKNTILAGIFTAILVTTRVVGILLPGLVFFTFGIKYFQTKKFPNIKIIGLYMIITVLLIYALWPTLWGNPLKEFGNALEQMAKYPQQTAGIYLGKKVKSTQVPWHYTPVFLAVTTPLMYTLAFLLGFVFYTKDLISKKLNLNLFLIFGWFLAPLIAVIYFRSTLYDAWRQMFFVYPAFLVISIFGIMNLYKNFNKPLKILLSLLIMFQLGIVLNFMIRWHPFQNVYYSELAGKKENIEKTWELDYWGIAYKQGLEFLEKYSDKETIIISSQNYPGENNLKMLENRDRFKFIKSIGASDYFLTNFRANLKKTKEGYEEIHTIRVEGYKILAIYKVK